MSASIDAVGNPASHVCMHMANGALSTPTEVDNGTGLR